MEEDLYSYNVALSFAGEDREYVEAVAVLLKSYGVKVFYDKFEETNLWGKNLFEYLNDVYKNKAKFTVMFISKHYKDKLWTNHERRSMQERAFIESSEYILPARFDDTEIPGLHSTISYIDLRDKSPSNLANIICSKIGWITKNRWWGEWNVETVVMSYYGSLKIQKVYKDHFEFNIETTNGAHTGGISGEAFFSSANEAIFCLKEYDDQKECILRFLKTNDIIQIDEDSGCLYYHGMRAHFGGDYKLKKDVFYRIDFINDIVLTKMHQFLKSELWEEYLKCFGDIHYDENINTIDKKIIKAAVPGLYTIYEAILIIDKSDAIWGAFLDVEKVYYFTSENTFKNKLPDIIEEWRINFKDKEIIYLNTE
jgi:hypothetical protein